jgi:hypothetical protein
MALKQKRYGSCRLCNANSLLVEGHILPKFLLRQTGLTGANKKFMLQCYSNPAATEAHRQDGFKEYLMCEVCDGGIIGTLENYASKQFRRDDSPLSQVPSNGFLWSDLDYAKMKLFTISLLWRMSLSIHGWFGHVRLGSKHEEAMRLMLLKGDPGEPWRYGWTIGGLLFGPKALGAVFIQPEPILVKNVKCYRLVLGGILCFAFVSSRRLSDDESRFFLGLGGVWPVPTAQALSIAFVKDAIDLFRSDGIALKNQ